MKSHIWDHSMGVFNMNGDNMIENLAHPKRLRLVSLDSTLTPSWPMKTWTNCFTWSDPHRDRLFCHSFWHLIWKYIWYILSDILFWHSFLTWHSIFWHSILAFYLAFYSDILFWHSTMTSYLDILLWHLFWPLLWHSFWYSIWHLFWHSFWHSIWHSIWHSFLAFYLASFLASMLTFSLALSFFLIFYLASIRTFYSAIFSDIHSGILPGIFSGILSGIRIWHCILAFYLASILAFSLTWALPDLNRERQISVGLIWRSRLRSGRHLAEERRRGRGEGRKVGKWGKMQKVWYRLAQVPKFPWLSSKTMI